MNSYWILWNNKRGDFTVLVDIHLKTNNQENDTYYYVSVEGNTKRRTINSTLVVFSLYGRERFKHNLQLGRKKKQVYTEREIRTCYPELDLEWIDEEVNKTSLFARISV